jgi:hypothetical protein
MTRPHRPEGQRPGLEARRYSDRTYHVPDRRPLPDRRDEYEVMKVAPWRHKERVKAGDRSLYDEERWRQRREQGKPAIVHAELCTMKSIVFEFFFPRIAKIQCLAKPGICSGVLYMVEKVAHVIPVGFFQTRPMMD